jgi:hypothetical protein
MVISGSVRDAAYRRLGQLALVGNIPEQVRNHGSKLRPQKRQQEGARGTVGKDYLYCRGSDHTEFDAAVVAVSLHRLRQTAVQR